MLLASHNMFIFVMSSCNLCCIFVILFPEIYKVELSANISINELLVAKGRSFTQSKNNNGPIMEPCGTPVLMGSNADVVLPSLTHYILFVN